MAVIGALERIRAEGNSAAFIIKGGVALELRDPKRSRATRDLDVSYRLGRDGLEAALHGALAQPVGDFTFAVQPRVLALDSSMSGEVEPGRPGLKCTRNGAWRSRS